MPPRFVPAPSPRCPQCSKAVYLAEQVIGPNGASWHKSCFVCVRCNRRLDTSTLAEHEGKAYCQPCHKLVWGPTGYGFGSGLVPEDPENQFKQSIGRPVNSSSSDDMEDGVARHPTGGNNNNNNDEETEEERRERLTPVNASLQRRNSLEMIRQQAEASRRAYDEAYSQRLNANRNNNPVHPNFTGGSTTSTGSKGDSHNNLDGGYGSDSSSAFGSTIATTSSPAPSLSSVSSSTSSQQQPATKTLYLNQPIKSVGRVPSPQSHDPDSDYAKSRQALSYQTGAPSIPSGPPSLPKRNPEPVNAIPRSSTGGSSQGDDSYSKYAPARIVARKEEPSAAQAVDEDEWDTAEPAQKPQEPMYLSQYLKQQKQKEQQQQQQQQQQQHSTPTIPSGPPSLPKRSAEPVAAIPSSHTGDKQRDDSYSDYIPVRIVARKEEPRTSQTSTTTSAAVADDEWDTEPAAQKPQAPPMYQSQYLKQQQKQTERSPMMSTPSVLSSFNTRSNPLLNETDRLHMREQEERHHQRAATAQDNANAVERDEWDEEPTPTVPSKPQNLKYTSAYTPPSVAPRTMPTSYGNDICRVCQKVVYHAEMARAHGSVYHKTCLKCFSCKKGVDATNMVDRKGTPYCKHCYSKEFGAKGYGYGAGSDVLHTEL